MDKGINSLSTSKTVYKRTNFENGKRKTITYTKEIDKDGKVIEQAKEETENEKGEKTVRFIDDMSELFKEKQNVEAKQIGEKSEKKAETDEKKSKSEDDKTETGVCA